MICLIDLTYLACNQVHVVIEQVTLRADQLMTLGPKLVKWQVEPAWHIHVFPSTINQGDFRFLMM
jgi:metal-sulfur cluster biosynthetic enzyme